MSQIALPLAATPGSRAARIVVGSGNHRAVEALAHAATWPFGTAVLGGPPRSGKSLLARWFAQSGKGEAIDDADRMDETELFHRWNRAQHSGTPLLLIGGAGEAGWDIALPDLASRLKSALHLAIGPPDDAMLAELIASGAEARGLALGEGAAAYLVPRTVRSYAGIEALVATIDRLSMERKAPATLALWRDALDAVQGAVQPRLL